MLKDGEKTDSGNFRRFFTGMPSSWSHFIEFGFAPAFRWIQFSSALGFGLFWALVEKISHDSWKKYVIKTGNVFVKYFTVPMSWGNTPPPQPSCPVLLRLRSPNLSWRFGDVLMCAIVARLQIAHMNTPISFVAFGSLDRTAVWWAILLVVHALFLAQFDEFAKIIQFVWRVAPI